MSVAPNTRRLELERSGTYIQQSFAALYLFDSCITFSQEVEVIWRRQWSAVTWIYAFTRYDQVLLVLFNLIPVWGLEDCRVSVYIDDALELIQFLCFACFAALRVYALLDGRKLVATIVFLLNLTPFVVNLYIDTTTIASLDSEVCETISPWSESFFFRSTLATRIAIIIGDVLVLLVTWSKTAQFYRESKRLRIKAPLATLLFRDGTLYFVILLAINLLQVVERKIPTLFTLEFSQLLLETFVPLIICRFTLDLRQVKSPGDSWVSGSQSASLRFVGHAGGSLQFGEYDDEEWEGDAVEQSHQIGGSSVPIEGKDKDESMTVTAGYLATSSRLDTPV